MHVKPKVSIIILNFNGRSSLGELLDRAIESALNQEYPNIEVLIVDNGSTDDSFEYLSRKYGDKAKIIRFKKNYGFCLGSNFAEVLHLQSSLLYLETLFAFGAALLVRRKFFELIGGFPSEFFLYFDEADLGLRFRALGLEIVGTNSTFYIHFVSGIVSKVHINPVVLYFTTRNRLLIVPKYFYGIYLLKALVLNLAISSYHLCKKKSLERRVILQAVSYIIKNIREIIKVRKAWIPMLKRNKVLERFLVKWPRA